MLLPIIKMGVWMIRAFVVTVALLHTTTGFAQIMHSYRSMISFTEGSPTDGVEWSAALRLSRDGLIASSDGAFEPPDFAPNSIQTPPIPADWSWRLPSLANVRIDVHGELSPRRGREDFPARPLRAFVRYGIDRVHWSSWYEMPEVDDADTDARRFRARIQLPAVARSQFNRLKREWEVTKPEWTDDEHALCVWIAQHHPDYFSREVPLIGYIQVRLESISSGMNVTAIDIVGSGSASGFSSVGGGTRTTVRESWHCDLTEYVR
jgi:hypothetical protein